ncbi:hypothetical protein PoB_004820100 [Plakobranchus ocellatus]|uniref:Glycosyltransferase family 92 protein n=1 Tax=Plakobranchus ocellatus TaxID=259542 RepID=A0AAV4BMK2_9GAST|nr:hypothetical protein PoB_004820100 [Plakobranchus ocellatus]
MQLYACPIDRTDEHGEVFGRDMQPRNTNSHKTTNFGSISSNFDSAEIMSYLDDFLLVEIHRKNYLRRKTRRRIFTTFCASSSDQSDWDSDKGPDYIPQDDQPSDDDWMLTEKIRTPKTSTQSEPITALKYMQVSVDAMRVMANGGGSDCNYAVLFLLGVIVILLVMLASQSKRDEFLPPQISRFADKGFDSKTDQASDVKLSAPVQSESDNVQSEARGNVKAEVGEFDSKIDRASKVRLSASVQLGSDKVQPEAGGNVKDGVALGAASVSGKERATPSVNDFTRELNLRIQRPSTNQKLVFNWPCDDSQNVSACVGPCEHPLKYSPRERVEKLMIPELTLSARQRRTIQVIGKSVPNSDLIIASAVSSNHYGEMQMMFKILHIAVYPDLEERMEATKKDPLQLQKQNKVPIRNFTVTLFDLGLSPEERRITEKNCRCKVITFRKELFPEYVSENRCYAWKPIIVNAASQHAKKLIVWQDSSVRWFRESFLDSLDRAYAAGHQVLRHFNSHRIPANTLKETFDYIHEDACGYLPYPEIQGNIHIHRADEFNRRVVFEPWTRCALEKQCICPRFPESVIHCTKGTLHRCHRFDQSAMSIILSILYQKDLWKIQFRELFLNRGPDFRVLRGQSSKKYFVA